MIRASRAIGGCLSRLSDWTSVAGFEITLGSDGAVTWMIGRRRAARPLGHSRGVAGRPVIKFSASRVSRSPGVRRRPLDPLRLEGTPGAAAPNLAGRRAEPVGRRLRRWRPTANVACGEVKPLLVGSKHGQFILSRCHFARRAATCAHLGGAGCEGAPGSSAPHAEGGPAERIGPSFWVPVPCPLPDRAGGLLRS